MVKNLLVSNQQNILYISPSPSFFLLTPWGLSLALSLSEQTFGRQYSVT
jgi:hypothetical protein